MHPIMAADDRRPIRILIADADADTRSLYEEVLTLAGCDVVQARDGRDALVKALSTPPTLLITETYLPFLSGYDLCGLLRHDSATRALPILVVTTETRLSRLERVRATGVDSVLNKPVDPDQLVTEIQHMLECAERSRLIARPARSDAEPTRISQAKAHRRTQTTTPPNVPPSLVCPSCARPLTYAHSFVGGVSRRHAEQWDAYTCPAACGQFEYRQRTRKLRPVSEDDR